MEIERKFIPKQLPDGLEQYACRSIEQGYLCTNPTIRIRKMDDTYFLTYKSSGLLAHQEYEMPLTKEAYLHLRKKADGILITKSRYLIPLDSGHTAELDIFHGSLEGTTLAEVEFASVEEAQAFVPPDWFGKDVTYDSRYHNSEMSKGALSNENG
ncbi:MAG: CYTH domain-containing protein [Eubacterium sp.]|nr:CYTH domain-containing protein [Eubacterium sp.]